MRTIQIYWFFPLFVAVLVGAVVAVIDFQVTSFRNSYFAALEQEIGLRNHLFVGVCKAMIEQKMDPKKMDLYFRKQSENPFILRIKKVGGPTVFETSSSPDSFRRMLQVQRIRNIMRGPARDEVFFEYNPYHKTYFAYNAMTFSCSNNKYVLIMAEKCDSVTRLVRLSEFAIYVFSTMGIVIVAGLIIYFLAQVRSPLKRLKVSTREIASGNFDYPVYVPRTGIVREIAMSVRDMAEHLKGQILQLRRFETQRREFFGAISHAMKTPLTGILSAVEGIEQGALENPEYRKECINALKLQSGRLSELLHEFLALNTIEMLESKKERDFTPAYLADILYEATEGFFHNKNCPEFVFETGEYEEKEICVNQKLLVQAFENLFYNAILHGGATRISVRVSVSGGKSALTIDVCDNGTGIPVSDREKVFERFYSSLKSKNNPVPGNGLGLVIVRRVIELHGGTVGIVDGYGEWKTVFRIILPVSSEDI